MLEKIYWNKHKYDRNSLDLNSFDSALNFCLFYEEESSVYIANNKNNLFFSPLLLDFKVSLIYNNKVQEFNVSARLLLSNQYDIFLVLLSYYKEILSNSELNYLITFLGKLRFYRKSKSRFINSLSINNNDISIEFNNLPSSLVAIIFN